MPVKNWNDWSLSERGKADAARHREKIDKTIRNSVQNVISEESIITKRSGRTVRIPVRGLKDYRFVYGKSEGAQGGVGQGKGKVGDIIAKKPGKGSDNKPGSEPGDDFLETEVSLDHIIDMMMDDLGLPYIMEKLSAAQLVPVGFKFDSISKVGIMPRLHKKRTLKESIKRMVVFAQEVMDETGCSEDDATRALIQTVCNIDEAITLVKTNMVDPSIEPNILIDSDDLRFKQIEEDYEVRSNAVIICIMDTSGSMDTNKKYLVRSFLFWFVEFLRKTYDNVQIRFITHTTDAHLVDEDEFFHKGSDGGTVAHIAFDLAEYTLMTEYPLASWNRYICYAGDGQLFDADETITSIKSILKAGINMLNYIQVEEERYAYGQTLLQVMRKHLNFDRQEMRENKAHMFKNTNTHIYACQIREKTDVWEALKFFLFEKNESKK